MGTECNSALSATHYAYPSDRDSRGCGAISFLFALICGHGLVFSTRPRYRVDDISARLGFARDRGDTLALSKLKKTNIALFF